MNDKDGERKTGGRKAGWQILKRQRIAGEGSKEMDKEKQKS